MAERVSSYDPNARLPKVGTRWVWEINSPHARELVEVEEVFWNGEEWWVRLARLPSAPAKALEPIDQKSSFLNDIGRFWEAVVPVGGKLTGRRDLWERRSATQKPQEAAGA